MNEATPSTLPLSPAALRAAMTQLEQIERAEREAAVARQREAQDQAARQRSQRIDEAADRVRAALARYDEAASALREVMQEVLAAEAALMLASGSSLQASVLVPKPLLKVHAPSLKQIEREGFGGGFSTTEALMHEAQAAAMRGQQR